MGRYVLAKDHVPLWLPFNNCSSSTGSKTFSDIAANEDRTEVFTQSMVDIYNQYGLDGIDIDWEYPGAPGAEGNAIDLTNDRQNYLRLLRRLRLALPRDALLTAAVSIDTFHVNGSPEMDASDFAAVLDYIYPVFTVT